MKGGESRRSLVQMDSIACMDGKGGAVGKQIMAAAPETPVKPLEPLVASPPSHTKKNAYLDFGKDDDVREASVKTLPGASLFPFPPFPLWLCRRYGAQAPWTTHSMQCPQHILRRMPTRLRD